MPHFFDMSRKPPAGELPEIGGADTRRERTVQRLQIGITGVVLMVLLIGLASIINDRADLTDATSVPEAASTTEPTSSSPQNDPLAEAGVVPDMAADPVADQPPSESLITQQDAPASTN